MGAGALGPGGAGKDSWVAVIAGGAEWDAGGGGVGGRSKLCWAKQVIGESGCQIRTRLEDDRGSP